MQSWRCHAISCRFAAVQRQNNCWFHIDLREGRKRRHLAVFIQWREKKKKRKTKMTEGNGEKESPTQFILSKELRDFR